jgi:hypothetical protein
MRLYTVHYRRRADEDQWVLVKEGFNWPAFLITLPWALWHWLWLPLLGWLALSVAIAVADQVLGLPSVVETAAVTRDKPPLSKLLTKPVVQVMAPVLGFTM